MRMPDIDGLGVLQLVRDHHAEISSEVAGSIDVLIPKPVSLDTFNQLLDNAKQIRQVIENLQSLGTAPTSIR